MRRRSKRILQPELRRELPAHQQDRGQRYGAHPLYKWLIGDTGGADIQWNFEKFLIGKDGRIIKRYSSRTVPEDPQLRADLQAAL